MKTRWSQETPPDRTTLEDTMRAEGLRPYAWSSAPGDEYPAHVHSYNKVIYVVSGSIAFSLPDQGRQIALEVGDRLDLPAGTAHSAIVGSGGVVCLEAQVP